MRSPSSAFGVTLAPEAVFTFQGTNNLYRRPLPMAERLGSEQIKFIVDSLTQGIGNPNFRNRYADNLRAVLSGCLPNQAREAIIRLDEYLGIQRPEEQPQPQVAVSPEPGYSSERVYAEMLDCTRRENAAYPIKGQVSRAMFSGRVTEETNWQLIKAAGGVHLYFLSGEAALPNGLIVNSRTLINIGQMVTNQFATIGGRPASPDQNSLVFARAGWAIIVSIDSRPVVDANRKIRQEDHLVFKGLPDSQTLPAKSPYREGHGFLLLPEGQGGRQDLAARLQSYKTSVSIIAGAFSR